MNTICAISTPIGNGGIGIIRISGEKSLEIINQIFKTHKSFEPNTIIYGKIHDNDIFIDEALVSYFKAPNSYTGEDVIEINSHGGMVVLQRILGIVMQKGAKLAEPGEFTKRAFLNGKLDLTQAESVMDIINSKSELENKNSAKILSGELGTEIREIKNSIMDILIDLEANVDYPEYDIEEVTSSKVKSAIEVALKRLQKLSRSYEEGKILKNGINVSIVGKPNVGKSSLLNRLLKEERAIVTEIAGTTRDTIEETIIHNGVAINIIDTAGIHETNDKVENIGVNKSIDAISNSDLIIFVIDNSGDIDNEDLKILEHIGVRRKYVVVNKIDINSKIPNEIKSSIGNSKVFMISAKENIGIDEMLDSVVEDFKLNNISNNNELIITNKRHKEMIDKTIESFKNVLKNIELNVPLDMISIDIQNGISSLNYILGEDVSEDVINGIFKKFCLGK